MKKRSLIHVLPILTLMLLLFIFPQSVNAESNIYTCKGVTGNITFNSAPLPNAKWAVGNKSVLKIKSSSSTKVVYTGKKVGKTTLTVYNSEMPSQSYSWIVYVMPSKKLNKMDFEVYGSRAPNAFGFSEGTNIIGLFRNNYDYLFIARENGVTPSTSASYFQTARTLQFYDSYKKLCTLYGKLSLKKYKPSKDRFYKYIMARKTPSYQNALKIYFSNNVKYYADSKFGKKYMIRFLFDRNKQLSGIIYFKNYKKLPVK